MSVTNLQIPECLIPSPIQELKLDILLQKGIRLWIKRDDMIHSWLSGNKYRKLKYNLIEAIQTHKKTIITFGGPFSNHLYAVAGAASLLGLKSMGLVRGEIDTENPTIRCCTERNMELISIPRSHYRLKHESDFVAKILGDVAEGYLIPEGGTNLLALRGVSELIPELQQQMEFNPNYIILPCGTGGTTAGLCISDHLRSHIISFSALKSTHLYDEILTLSNNKGRNKLSVNTDNHFGGYGKWNEDLLHFIDDFETKTDIPLDHVYNGKAMYGLMNLIKSDYFVPGTTICYIHTGGLQGKLGLDYMRQKGM
jgi:1-aminocyclopropane-1-carboxylate deaminase